MVIESEFKKTKAIQLENDNLKVIILPCMGAKLHLYFLKRDFELIFQNKEEMQLTLQKKKIKSIC